MFCSDRRSRMRSILRFCLSLSHVRHGQSMTEATFSMCIHKLYPRSAIATYPILGLSFVSVISSDFFPKMKAYSRTGCSICLNLIV